MRQFYATTGLQHDSKKRGRNLAPCSDPNTAQHKTKQHEWSTKRDTSLFDRTRASSVNLSHEHAGRPATCGRLPCLRGSAPPTTRRLLLVLIGARH